MERLQILGSLRSTYSRVVCMACVEKGVDYVLVDTTLGHETLKAVHPFGRMPVMRHGDLALFESKAIATYLDRRFAGPELIPSDPYRWVSLVNTTMDPILVRTYLLAYAFPNGPAGQPDRTVIDGVLPAVRTQIDALDRAVAATGHLAGDGFTFADINLMPILDLLRLPPESAEAIAGTAHLSAYFTRHAARPSFLQTIPSGPPAPPKRT